MIYRNLSYGRQNDENKRAIKNAGGITALVRYVPNHVIAMLDNNLSIDNALIEYFNPKEKQIELPLFKVSYQETQKNELIGSLN